MDAIQEVFEKIHDFFIPVKTDLSPFQKAKLLHEFHTFYDVNKDGCLQWKDFDLARKHICKLNGWDDRHKKAIHAMSLFREMWRYLQDDGDKDLDGKITQDEWLKVWQDIYKAFVLKKRKEEKKAAKLAKKGIKTPEEELQQIEKETKKPPKETKVDDKKVEESNENKAEEEEETVIPLWFERYIEYKFNLYDRAGDDYIDIDEFEYILSSGFDCSPKDCRAAFTQFSQSGEKKVDREYFRELALEFYLSNDPCALGNFINGKLLYDTGETEK